MIKIKSLNEFIKQIISLSESKMGKELMIFYRGESKDWGKTKCQPGIFRSPNLIKNEHILFKEFITLTPNEFTQDKLTIDKLTRMQHYGLPTRLLDLSSNALLALYMSLPEGDKNEKTEDSIVYIFFIPQKIIKFYDSDRVCVLSNLAKREKFDFPHKNERSKERFNKEKNILYLLHNIKDEKPYFKDEIVPEHLYSIVCVRPLQNNQRIIRQQGLFLLFGNDKKDKYKPANLKESGIHIEKIVIDKNYKSAIKKHLEMTGLSKAVVYPDMGKIAEYLNDKYK